ncbi:hypothetical protein BH11VER1_BH11VER1_10910 [soil metagenome]
MAYWRLADWWPVYSGFAKQSFMRLFKYQSKLKSLPDLHPVVHAPATRSQEYDHLVYIGNTASICIYSYDSSLQIIDSDTVTFF